VNPKDLQQGSKFQLTNPKVKNPGSLELNSFQIIKRPTFVDYLKGGLQLNMMVAIDFTGSNGHPKYPNSLHYMNPNAPNQYQLAIHAIAGILMNYDSDKRIPAFGFGATTNFGGIKMPVSHCFALSGNPS
jgi:hypothetical protein